MFLLDSVYFTLSHIVCCFTYIYPYTISCSKTLTYTRLFVCLQVVPVVSYTADPQIYIEIDSCPCMKKYCVIRRFSRFEFKIKVVNAAAYKTRYTCVQRSAIRGGGVGARRCRGWVESIKTANLYRCTMLFIGSRNRCGSLCICCIRSNLHIGVG